MDEQSSNNPMEIWSEYNRHKFWLLLTRMRLFLALEIHPQIVSAFTILHKYLQEKTSTPYSVTILVVTSLFVATKATETPRLMKVIFNAFLQSAKDIYQKFSKDENFLNFLGFSDFTPREMTVEEIKQVNSCEIDLLSAINFQLDLKLPFSHLKRIVEPFLDSCEKKMKYELTTEIHKGICISLLSTIGSQMDPSIIAAAAVFNGFTTQNIQIPPDIESWIAELSTKAGDNWSTALQVTLPPKKPS